MSAVSHSFIDDFPGRTRCNLVDTTEDLRGRDRPGVALDNLLKCKAGILLSSWLRLGSLRRALAFGRKIAGFLPA